MTTSATPGAPSGGGFLIGFSAGCGHAAWALKVSVSVLHTRAFHFAVKDSFLPNSNSGISVEYVMSF